MKAQPTPYPYATGKIVVSGMPYPSSEVYGAYGGDIVPDEETAYIIANAVYKACISKTDGRVIREIVYDDIYDAWYISFKVDEEVGKMGGGYGMYLRKSDGKVLSVFMVE